jgi:hypothetical protein
MRELPRPIRHKKKGVANRADNVVDKVTGAESAVTTFVSDHPNSSENATLAQPIRRISGADGDYAIEKH